MNIFGMGPMELILILVIALIVFGPSKLPEIAGGIGRAIREFRRMSADVTRGFNEITAELQGNEPQRANQGESKETLSAVSTADQSTSDGSAGETDSAMEAKAQAQEDVLASAESTLFDELPKTIVFEPPKEAVESAESEEVALASEVAEEPDTTQVVLSGSGRPAANGDQANEHEDVESEVKVLEK